MSETPELWLPENHELTDVQSEMHERLASISLDEYRAEMVDRYPHISVPSKLPMRVVDMQHPDQADTKRAAVMLLPFGNPRSEAMHIRARAVQDFMDEPTRLIVVPNNTRSERNYSFENHKQDDGVELLGNMVLRNLVELGIEDIAIIGYSQGASVGASMTADAERYDIGVSAAYLGDPADVVERTNLQLQLAFMRSGSGLNKAINDSGIPALSEAQFSRGGMDTLRQMKGMIAVARNAQLLENKMLHHSMTQNRFSAHLREAIAAGLDKELVSVAIMEDSNICIPKSAEDIGSIIDRRPGVRVITLPGYGHVAADNVAFFASESNKALVQADFWAQAA